MDIACTSIRPSQELVEEGLLVCYSPTNANEDFY